MIAALSGTVLHRTGETVIIDAGGVGYELQVGPSVNAAIGAVGTAVALFVYTDVRENAITLYGFRDLSEREVFLLLRKVKGIGSRTALLVLSGIGPEKLLLAIGRGDIGALQKVPGIGRKTAERIVVELREHVGALVERGADSADFGVVEGGGELRLEKYNSRAEEDAVLALEKLGFPVERARTAVTATLRDPANKNISDAGELLRLSLGNL